MQPQMFAWVTSITDFSADDVVLKDAHTAEIIKNGEDNRYAGILTEIFA